MKFFILLACLQLVSCHLFQPKLEKEKERQSYHLGYSLGNNLKKSLKDIDIDKLILGIKHSVAGQESLLNKKNPKDKKLIERRKMENTKFLEDNKAKEGVKTTASGLQYKVIKTGKGRSPKSTDEVEVHYKGQLINGQEFDSSYKRNKSISFPLNQVIKGWTEGLQLMQEGSTYEFYIPPSLGLWKCKNTWYSS